MTIPDGSSLHRNSACRPAPRQSWPPCIQLAQADLFFPRILRRPRKGKGRGKKSDDSRPPEKRIDRPTDRRLIPSAAHNRSHSTRPAPASHRICSGSYSHLASSRSSTHDGPPAPARAGPDSRTPASQHLPFHSPSSPRPHEPTPLPACCCGTPRLGSLPFSVALIHWGPQLETFFTSRRRLFPTII